MHLNVLFSLTVTKILAGSDEIAFIPVVTIIFVRITRVSVASPSRYYFKCSTRLESSGRIDNYRHP